MDGQRVFSLLVFAEGAACQGCRGHPADTVVFACHEKLQRQQSSGSFCQGILQPEGFLKGRPKSIQGVFRVVFRGIMAGPNLSQAVQGKFHSVFSAWGSFVGRRPYLVIVLSFLLFFAGSFRLLLAPAGQPIPSVVEQDQLWVPQTAEAVTDKGRYDAIFTNTFRRNTIYFTTKPPGGNVLTSKVLAEIRRFDLMVTSDLNATAFGAGASATEVKDDAGRLDVNYNDVCAKSSVPLGRNLSDPDDEGGIPCILFGHPLEAFYRIGGVNPGEARDPDWVPGEFVFDFTDDKINEILTSKRGVDETLYPPTANRTINVEAAYGGIERDASGKITGAKAVAMSYLLGEFGDGTPERNRAIAWEDQLNYLIGKEWTDVGISEGSASGHYTSVGRTLTPDDDASLVWKSDIIDIFPSTAGSTSRELGKNIRGDLTSLQAVRHCDPTP